MNKKEVQLIAKKIKKLGEEVWKTLGGGFNETIYQSALAIEFRNKKIEYLKEVNIEIFYKGESVGVDRPDFIITKIGNFKKPILLEMKVTDRISDDHRTQLQSYCTSLPFNNSPVLNDFAGGILMSLPKCDISTCSMVKIFVVDSKFNIISDDQKEEEARIALDKEKLRLEKLKKKTKK